MGNSSPGPPAVLVVGQCGVGKSTLCNFLLFGNGEEIQGKPIHQKGFKVGPSGNPLRPVTTECSVKEVTQTPPPSGMDAKPGQRLQVIDTPGLPNPRGHTLVYYNRIVKRIKELGKLNALLLMISADCDREEVRSGFANQGILLRQLGELPCPTIAVCRANILDALDGPQRLQESARIQKRISSILADTKIRVARTLILSGGEVWSEGIFALRNEVCCLPTVPIKTGSLSTYEELTKRYDHLVDRHKRMKELKLKDESLKETKQHLEHVVSLESKKPPNSVVCSDTLEADLDWSRKEIRKMIVAVDDEIQAVDEELNNGEIDEDALEGDEKVLGELANLARIDVEQKPVNGTQLVRRPTQESSYEQVRGYPTVTEETETPTVLVLGKSGMGKSTLCNHLLYSQPFQTEGFKIRAGDMPATTKCSVKQVTVTIPPRGVEGKPGGKLAVIDTPGLPDSMGRTLTFYDDIVRGVRRAGSLNAVIVVLSDGVQSAELQRDLGEYGILFKQFRAISCPKILLCRFKVSDGLDKAYEKRKVTRRIQNILAMSELQISRTMVLEEGKDWARGVFSLREEICNLPTVRCGDWCMQTIFELMASLGRLVKSDTRNGELDRKRKRLEVTRQGLMIATYRCLADDGHTQPLAKATIENNARTRAENLDLVRIIDKQIKDIDKERAASSDDHEARENDQRILTHLQEMVAKAGKREDREDTTDEMNYASSHGDSRTTPTVMIIGKSGTGKSTLGNYLLFGKPKLAKNLKCFPVKGGGKPVTTECSTLRIDISSLLERKDAELGKNLAVIDTPGLPDPGGCTVEYYDKIVATVRSAGHLSAVVILVAYGTDREHIKADFKTNRLLMSQVNEILCPKILVCRAPINSDLDPQQRAEEIREIEGWIESLLVSSQMHVVSTVLLTGNSMAEQVLGLRQTLCRQSSTSTRSSFLLTFKELEKRLERLSNPSTREKELEKQRKDLERKRDSILQSTRWSESTQRFAIGSGRVVGSGIFDMCVGVGGIVCALDPFGPGTSGYTQGSKMIRKACVEAKWTPCGFADMLSTIASRNIAMKEKRLQRIERDLEALEGEVCFIDMKALERDQKRLKELLELKRMGDQAAGTYS